MFSSQVIADCSRNISQSKFTFHQAAMEEWQTCFEMFAIVDHSLFHGSHIVRYKNEFHIIPYKTAIRDFYQGSKYICNCTLSQQV